MFHIEQFVSISTLSKAQRKISKTCNCCGKKYTQLPDHTVIHEGLYWFDCSCKSTLVTEVKQPK